MKGKELSIQSTLIVMERHSTTRSPSTISSHLTHVNIHFKTFINESATVVFYASVIIFRVDVTFST